MNPESKKVAVMSNDEERQSRLRADEEVLRTVMNQLPGELTAAYYEACRLAPKVVAKESSACWFLNFHESDPLAAARLLAHYWKKRKEIFAERAFLPINLTGHGAMTADDVKLLQTGFTINLPRDEKNRSVLYTDMSKKPPDTVPSPRIVFFFFQCIMENSKASHNPYGHVLLYNISNPFASSFETENVECMQYLLQHCMPVGQPLVYFIYIPVDGAIIDQSFIDTVYTVGMNRFDSCFDEQSKHSHIASSKDDCLAKLVKCGLTAERLPVSLGGSWTGGCEPWRRKGRFSSDDYSDGDDDDGDDDEMRLEIESDATCLIRNALWCYNQNSAAGGAPTVLSSSAFISDIRPTRGNRRRRRQKVVTTTTEESSEEDRKMPAISDSNLQEDDDDDDDDDDERAASVDRNRFDSDESSKIPVAPAAAAAAASSSTSQEQPSSQSQARIALRRKRDIVYAKRKRERKKIEIEVLRQECNRLSASNEALRAERARLDELLIIAQQQVLNRSQCTT